MQRTITGLTIQKNNKERVSVHLDGKYAFSVDLMVAALLKKGQELSVEEIDRLLDDDRYSLAYSAAIRFLGARPRSSDEMKKHLKGKDCPEDVIDITIQRLEKDKYIDDKEFAKMWVETRERLNPKSAYFLKQELRQKGIEVSLIDSAVTCIDEEKSAWNAVKNKLYKWEKLERVEIKKKIFSFLGSRGFRFETASGVFEKAVHKITNEDL